MLNELISWWWQRMLELVPERWRVRAAGPAQAIVLAWREAGCELLTRRDHREASLGRFVPDDAGIRSAKALLSGKRMPLTVLRLPPGFVLERQVTLPLAAEQGLDRVVRYEMDRFTPFAADEVFWSCAVQRRDRAQGKLTASIALVPRLRVLPMLEVLAQLQLAPGVIESESYAGAPRLIPLAEPDLRREGWRRRAMLGGLAGCAALAAVAVALPFLAQQQARDAVEEQIAALKPRVKEADALRRKLSASAEGSDAISSEHERLGDSLQAVALLTELLGDDTHLIGLAMHQRQVTLEGQSAAAARLITTLSANARIRNAAFSAPVMRSETGADLFSIKVEVTP